ncbi:MAG: MBL fold metallo-hydrolase [Phycisphaerales bacterium]|nr:MAG: MBL fold metallo-hydrolase [Phycisphaerales bacterium]
MSFSFCVLGSGSKGNSTLLVLEEAGAEHYLLIDCGLSPRATARRLAPLGVSLDQISDIILTHLDWDHFYSGWVKQIEKLGITVHVHRRHRSAALRQDLDGRHMDLFDDAFSLFNSVSVQPFLFAHDELGTAGFIIEHSNRRLGYATDLGRVPQLMLDNFVNLHAVALESNYDPAMQLGSSRPPFLKRRIMGGLGHLSNEESFEAVQHIAGQSDLAHIVPLHLSRQCNDPRLVKGLYADRMPDLLGRLTMSNQNISTPLLQVQSDAGLVQVERLRPGQQAAMF